MSQIRLQYNVPVAVEPEGQLVFGFENGQMRESAPVAWQEIDGRQVPVAASFRLVGAQEGALPWDATTPLTR